MVSRLSRVHRDVIAVGIAQEWTDAEIGRRIGRHRSTVGREIGRSGGRAGYHPDIAERLAVARGERPKPFKLVADPGLASAVTELLARKYSPQVVSVLLAREGRRVSAETIYRACYQSGRGLEGDAWKQLSRQRQKRKHGGRKWRVASGNPLGEPRSIHQRHPVSFRRVQPGHLEGDLIVGSFNQSAVITLCERVTRRTWLQHLPNGYKTEPVAAALIEVLERIPVGMRRTLTWDQGREMRYWCEVEAVTGTLIYFCDPHAPWQRPTSENNNGILRKWLPKATPLDGYSQTDLNQIEDLINNMPRRIFDWDTANNMYLRHLVASTG